MSKLFFYTHTHWDREWYLPFEAFRLQLVFVVRDVVEKLETGALDRFYLDGQAIIFEDVLELAPELGPRLKALMKAGKLAAGPWYVSADEMLVCGESLIRNLKLGLEITSQFGKPAMLGYCADTFGHSQDLPRILRGFGIDKAAVWRGVPQLSTGPVFWWTSPDNSRVLTYHFARGYYQTAFHEFNPQLPGQVESLAEGLFSWVESDGTERGKSAAVASPYVSKLDSALYPLGADHIAPPAQLAKIVAEINGYYKARKLKIQLVPIDLSAFFEQLGGAYGGNDFAQEIRGELRDNAAARYHERAYLLDGVLSTRLYLKRQNRISEYRLARLAEPLFSILQASGVLRYPVNELQHSWKLLLHNQPHDSICGCSIDEVHRQMENRSERLSDLLSMLESKARRALAGADSAGQLSVEDPEFAVSRAAVFNLSSSFISAPVFIKWALLPGEKLPEGPNLQIEKSETVDKLFSPGWGAAPYYKDVQLVEGFLWAEEVPGAGVKILEWPPPEKSNERIPFCTAGKRRISNGLIDVEVAADGALLAMAGSAAPIKKYKLLHEIRDTGDGGDTYNFDPIPSDRSLTARLTGVRRGKCGPLVSSLLLTYRLRIPEKAEVAGVYAASGELQKLEILKRSKRKIEHEITTEVILKRGVPIVFFETSWHNKSCDHLLEVVFNTGKTIKQSLAENHFSLAKRLHNLAGANKTLPVKAGCEALPNRFPCQRFVVANEQAFFNNGLPEFAALGKELSLTLLRSVSFLSKPRLFRRGGGAGPNLRTPGAECLGENRASYGWAPVDERDAARMYQLAEVYEGSLWATFERDSALVDGSFIDSSNPAIRLVGMHVGGDDDSVMVRLLNVSGSEQTSQVKLGMGFVFKGETSLMEGKEIITRTRDMDFAVNELKTIRLAKSI